MEADRRQGARDNPENAPDSDDELWDLARKMETYVKTRWYHLKGSPESFLGTEAVRWMMVEPGCPASTSEEAIALGNQMIKQGIICHVSLQRPLPFANAPYFYCFTPAYRVNNRIKINLTALMQLGGRLRASVEVKDRQFLTEDEEVVYPGCFVGSDAIKWMVASDCCPVSSITEAVDLGSYMVSKGLLSYGVSRDGKPNLPFKDDDYFYSFSPKVQPLGPEEVIAIEARTSQDGGVSPDGTQINHQTTVTTEGTITSPSFNPTSARSTAPESQEASSASPRIHRALLGPTLCKAITAAVKKEEANQKLRAEVKELKKIVEQKGLKNVHQVHSELNEAKKECKRLQEQVEKRKKQEEDIFTVVDMLQSENERLRKFFKEVQGVSNETDDLLTDQSIDPDSNDNHII